jgi:hypothetical protein
MRDLMNKIFINIIDSYWGDDDTLGFYEQGRKHRHSGTYLINLDINEFEEKLTYAIMVGKGDGLELQIDSVGNNHYIDIVLLLGDETDEEYNIDYILEFLNQFDEGNAINGDKISNFGSYIYLQYAPEDTKEITGILEEQGVHAEIITHTRSRFERGASDYWVAFLIGLASTATYESLRFVSGKVKEVFNNEYRDLHFGELNIDRVRSRLSYQTGVNEHDLILISFEEIENGQYKVIFRKRYEKISVIINENGDILSFQKHEPTQTRV